MSSADNVPTGMSGEDTGRATQDVLDRFTRLRGSLRPDRLETLLTRQTKAAVEVLGGDAAGISVLLADRMRVPLAASNPMAELAESLQFTLGQGPCLDAFSVGRSIFVADLDDPTCRAWQEWPAYARELLYRTPFRSVMATPLAAEGLSLGTLSLYRRRPAAANTLHLRDARAVAHHIFCDLLATGTFSGQVQPELAWANLPMARVRTVVWQAIGMVVVQLGMNTADGLALLRSYSFGHDLLLDQVAADVVAGRLPLTTLHP